MNKTLSIEELRFLSDEIMLEMSDSELQKLQKDLASVLAKMELVQEIDTEEVHAMHYPFDIELSYLREDDAPEAMTQEEALTNAPLTEAGYIVINKVVK